MPTIELFSKEQFHLEWSDSGSTKSSDVTLNEVQNLANTPIDEVCMNPEETSTSSSSSSPRWIIPLFLSYNPRGYVGPALVAGCPGTKGDDSGLVGDPFSVGCEDSAFDDIQDAVDYASDGDTIEVCDGIYDGFHNDDKSLTIKARDNHYPAIHTTDERYSVDIEIPNNGSFILDGFKVFNNGTTNNEYGIYASVGSHDVLSLLNLDVEGFELGIYVWLDSSEETVVKLSNLDLHNNGSGMSILDYGDYYLPEEFEISNVSIEDSVFYDNDYGLGIALYSDIIISMSNIEIYDNNNSGISVYQSEGSREREGNSTITATDINVHDNGGLIADSDGGGISLSHVNNFSIESSYITDNFAMYGGGIYLYDSSLVLTDTSVQSNISEYGGLVVDSGSSVISYYTNWNGTNDPYDVYCYDYPDSHVYNYGSNESFECKGDVGCSDL